LDPVDRQLIRAPDVVAVVGVATVDDDVARVQEWDECLERGVDRCRGTISQIVRGFDSPATRSASEVAPRIPDSARAATTSGRRV
jgi:hypothetical protein